MIWCRIFLGFNLSLLAPVRSSAARAALDLRYTEELTPGLYSSEQHYTLYPTFQPAERPCQLAVEDLTVIVLTV